MIKRLQWQQLENKRGLYHAAVTRLAARTKPYEHTQDFFEFFMVWEGNGVHQLNGRQYQLYPGRLAVVGRDDRHSFRAATGQTLVFANVAVSARWWSGFQEVAGAGAGWEKEGSCRGHFDPDKTMGRELHQLLLRLMSPGEPDVMALLDAWMFVLSSAGKSKIQPKAFPEAPAWLAILRADLKRPEWMPEPISFWQKRSGRSTEHLSRSCRKFYGMTLTELINRERTEQVKFLLQTGEHKITTAAFEVGFNNMAHFYRVFFRLTGKTPRQWREQAMRFAVPLQK